MFIEKLPIPSQKGKSPFSENDSESEIDQKVYELYGLTPEEIVVRKPQLLKQSVYLFFRMNQSASSFSIRSSARFL